MSDFIEPLFTFRELARGVDDATHQEQNDTRVRVKPRVSNIVNDAREVAYMMAGTPTSDPPQEDDLRFDGVITAETGRVVEDLIIAGIHEVKGELVVVNRQLCIGHKVCDGDHEQGPIDYPLTGHPDGEVMRMTKEGPRPLTNGRKTGIEFKVKGNYQFMNLALDGIMSKIGRDLMAQTVLYGDALGWDSVIIIILSADASAVRGNLRYGKYSSLASANEDDFHPKGWVWELDLTDLKDALIPDLHKRAAWFARRQGAGKDPSKVKFEVTPTEKSKFPWGWSEYFRLAQKDGDGTAVAPWPKLLKKGY